MRFYDREQEIAFLRETRKTAEKSARFTVVTGRRRIGKTTLVREAYKDKPFVYFFVARKAEADLCEAYIEEISEKLAIPTLGNSRHFSENYSKLQEIIERDYNTFSGLMLERYFHRKAIESGNYTRLGRWWDRRSENEVDMIAEDEISDHATFFEIKRQKEELSIAILKRKAEIFMQGTHQFKGYNISYEGLSMEDV